MNDYIEYVGNNAIKQILQIIKDGLISKEMVTKLEGIEDGANNYVHPKSHPASMIEALSSYSPTGEEPINGKAVKEALDTLTPDDVGAFPNIKKISGADVDTLVDTGLYYLTSPVAGKLPADYNGWLLVLDLGDGGVDAARKQIYWSYNGNVENTSSFQSYMRERTTAGVWGPWHRYAMEDDLNPATVGAFPMVKRITITGEDLNNYIEAGIFYFDSLYTPLNIPAGVNGWLIVLPITSGSTTKQIWSRLGTLNSNDYQTWVRTGNGTDWSDWRRFVTDPEVFLKTSAEMKWLDKVSKVYWFGSGQNSTTQNGYYKICSVDTSTTHISYGIKLRITSDNFVNYSQVPTEFWLIATYGTTTSAGSVSVYGDPNSLSSLLLKTNLFIKKKSTGTPTFELYYKRTQAYGEINVEVITEFIRLGGDQTKPFVSTGTWKMGDNTLIADIAETDYDVTALFDLIVSTTLNIGSAYRPVYMKSGVPTPITNILQLVDGSTAQNVLQIFDDGDETTNNGGNLIVQASGNTFIGGGEGAKNLYNAFEASGPSTGETYTKNGEVLNCVSDNIIQFFTDCQTIANRKGMRLTTALSLEPIANATGSLGSSTNHWKSAYIESIKGNSSTATKLQTARTVRTNLASTSAASFDGSANVSPGVTGTLPIENGGTGATTAAAALDNLLAGTASKTFSTSKVTLTFLKGNQGEAIINSTADAGAYVMLDKLNSTNGYFTDGVYQGERSLSYTAKATVDAGTNAVTKKVVLLNESGNSSFPGTVTASAFSGNASSATKLATARSIDGVNFDGSAAIVHYGTCSTAAATAAKVVACTGFTLITGAVIRVKFTVTNTAASPTLNVNNTGAKAIYYRGASISAKYLAANRTYEFVYNGTQFELVGDIDTNTTYSVATNTANGLMSSADKLKTNMFVFTDTTTGATATGTDSIAIGSSAGASGGYSTAIGSDAHAKAIGSVALGYNANASGGYSTALGYFTSSASINSVALGSGANALLANTTAVGFMANAIGASSTSLGRGASSLGSYSIAMGYVAHANGNYAIAIGANTISSAENSIALGTGTKISHGGSVAIGLAVNVSNVSSVALGNSSNVTGASSVALGHSARAHNLYSIAVGRSSSVSGNCSIALGASTTAAGNFSVSLGQKASVPNTSTNTIQLGDSGISALKCAKALTVTSDIRDKTDINDIDDKALKFINKIRAITYVTNDRDKYIDHDNLSEEDENNLYEYGICEYDRESHKQGTKKGTRRRVGVSAQQVQEAMIEVFGDSSYANIVDDNLFDVEDKDSIPDNIESKLSVNYSGFIPFLLKAIQELSEEVNRQRDEIELLRSSN